MQVLKEFSTSRRPEVVVFAGLAAAFLLTVLCYWQSLGGPFLFDDIPNLQLLGDRGGLTSADKTLDFITNTQSGPLGRPLSLLSFTFDGQNWPTDPRPFRVSNLLIHLINGLLVCFLTRSIFARFYQRETAAWLAVLCATLWLLHPLLVSTTAYIIQRMTQLGSLFTLLGLLCYMRGRIHLANEPLWGWSWIIVGMGISGALALLSKEIGILLPLYALAIEVTVFSETPLARRRRPVLVALLSLPVLMFVGYLAWTWDIRVASFEFREFTLPERLLTETVVVIDYLRQSLLPGLSGLGIFHDDFPVSRSLLDPPATVFSLFLIAALLIIAVWLRKKMALVSLGILWFFFGHSLEAGPISLELYFEHRNYLPLLGPLLAVCSLLPLLYRKLGRILPLLLVLVLALEAFLTWQTALLWSDENRLMQAALHDHPGSLRARQHVANRLILGGQFADALAMQESIATQFPEHTSTRLSLLNLRCLLDELSEDEVGSTLSFVRQSRFDLQIVGYLGPLLANASGNTCGALGLAEIDALFDTMLRNPKMVRISPLRGAIHYFKGISYYQRGNLAGALDQLDLSYAAKPEIDLRFQQIAWLLAAGRPDDAERYLILAGQHDRGNWLRANVRQQDIASFRRSILEARLAIQQRDDRADDKATD